MNGQQAAGAAPLALSSHTSVDPTKAGCAGKSKPQTFIVYHTKQHETAVQALTATFRKQRGMRKCYRRSL